MNTDSEERVEIALRALVELASANFPQCTDIKIETCGFDPTASLVIPAWMFSKFLKDKQQ